MGVPQVRRRRRWRRSTGTAADRQRMARGSPSGRWARWSAAGAGCSRVDDEPTTRAKLAETVAEWVPDAAERDWIERALLTLLGCRGRAWRADQLFGAWRTFFERIADVGHRRAGLRGHALRRPRPARLRRPPARVEPWRVRSTSSPLPARSCSSAAPTGAPASATSSRMYLEPLPEADMRELLGGLVPGLPEPAVARDRRARRRHAALRCRDRAHAARRGPPRGAGWHLRARSAT